MSEYLESELVVVGVIIYVESQFSRMLSLVALIKFLFDGVADNHVYYRQLLQQKSIITWNDTRHTSAENSEQ